MSSPGASLVLWEGAGIPPGYFCEKCIAILADDDGQYEQMDSWPRSSHEAESVQTAQEENQEKEAEEEKEDEARKTRQQRRKAAKATKQYEKMLVREQKRFDRASKKRAREQSNEQKQGDE